MHYSVAVATVADTADSLSRNATQCTRIDRVVGRLANDAFIRAISAAGYE